MAMPSSAPLPAPHMVARMLLVAGALQQARAQQVAAPARSPPGRSAKGNKGTVFQPVDGGMNRVCRGANFTDDPESDYMLHLGVATLGDCMRLCIEAPVCKGVEYNPNHHGGRCEVWTRAGGINATAPVPGFTCLRYGAVTERFDLLGGGANRACRGSSPEDNSEAYYTLHKGTASLAACKELCIRSSGCKGVEYNEQLDGGRCEVWTRTAGISSTAPASGFMCLTYGTQEQFEPVDGGSNRVCRGASPQDNSESYYAVYNMTATLDDCKRICAEAPVCKGIEYIAGHQGGRCEVWTRAAGIQAMVPANGFACLLYEESFEPVHGMADAACRGSNPADDSDDFYTVHTGVGSLAECKGLCASAAVCEGIEFTDTLSSGRCEIWTRTGGIGATMPRSGFTCLRYQALFDAAEPMNTTAVTGITATTTVSTTAAPVDTATSSTTAATTMSSAATTTVAGTMAAATTGTTTATTTVSPAATTSSGSSNGTSTTPDVPVQYTVTRYGAQHVFNSFATQDISVVVLTASTAVVCSTTRKRGSCSVLQLAGGGFTQGHSVEVGHGGEVERLSVARLSEVAALACYIEHEVGTWELPMSRHACRVLTLVGNALEKAEPMVLGGQDEILFSLVPLGLSPTAALVCYDRLEGNGLLGVCRALAVSGASLVQGQELELGAGDYEMGPEVASARLSAESALVCHRHSSGRATCSELRLLGAALAQGPSLALSDGYFHSLAVVGLSASSALVCYKDFAVRPAQSVCQALALSGAQLAPTWSVEVSPGRTMATRVSDRVALVCSVDTHGSHSAACAALALSSSALTKGPELCLNDGNAGANYAAAALTPNMALLCSEDRKDPASRTGSCARLAVMPSTPRVAEA
mmetsp:Transcript_83893/g.271506  ORF Transcript_83893/g.271506 Transcript_83893/m.271506 type:complete len:871 (-) Transcript_83893:335-2947(-)